MSEHAATVRWKLDGADFLSGKYSRAHQWEFDGGVIVSASSSPHVVPAPLSKPENVDPEEAFVAAISSCHMLTFLYLAGRARFLIESYEDKATGKLTRNEQGRSWIGAVKLRPKIVYAGDTQPTGEQEAQLHHAAHAECFIANSVKTVISIESAARR